MKYV